MPKMTTTLAHNMRKLRRPPRQAAHLVRKNRLNPSRISGFATAAPVSPLTRSWTPELSFAAKDGERRDRLETQR
jgi:hypothetical protein